MGRARRPKAGGFGWTAMGPILAKTQGEREGTPYAGVDGDSRIFGSAGCAARLGIRKETETENAAMPRIPPMFLMVFGLAAQAFLPAAPPGPRWWQWTLALPLALASLAFLFGSSMRFYRAGVSADPVDVDRPRALVRDGVYRVTRNPTMGPRDPALTSIWRPVKFLIHVRSPLTADMGFGAAIGVAVVV